MREGFHEIRFPNSITKCNTFRFLGFGSIIPQCAFLTQRQDARGRIAKVVPGKDEETAVIVQQVQAIILMAEVPSDPAIPCRTLPSRGGEAQKSGPFIMPRGQMPEGPTDLREEPQARMPLHLFPVLWLFKGTNRPDNDFLQLQDAHLPDEVVDMRRSQPFISHPKESVQHYMKLNENDTYMVGQNHPAGKPEAPFP